MFLDINVMNLVYTCVYLAIFILCFYILQFTQFEKLFKQGSIFAIRVGQILVSLALAYLVTQGIMSLVQSTQF